MDKNTITGFVLIGLILFGFTWYQSKQYDKQMAYQAQLDSVARVERAAEMAAQALEDSLENALHTLREPVKIRKANWMQKRNRS